MKLSLPLMAPTMTAAFGYAQQTAETCGARTLGQPMRSQRSCRSGSDQSTSMSGLKMPQPLTEFQDQGTSWNWNSLDARPECALGAARVASAWAFLEFLLIEVFFNATGDIELTDGEEPAFNGQRLASSTLSALESLTAKLDVIASGIDYYVPSTSAAFEQLRGGIRKCGRERNRIVHAVWGTNANFPNDIIRVQIFEDQNIKYTPQDFADTVQRINDQRVKIEEFDVACRQFRLAEFQAQAGGGSPRRRGR